MSVRPLFGPLFHKLGVFPSSGHTAFSPILFFLRFLAENFFEILLQKLDSVFVEKRSLLDKIILIKVKLGFRRNKLLTMEQRALKNVSNYLNINIYSYLETSETIFLVVCDPPLNEL